MEISTTVRILRVQWRHNIQVLQSASSNLKENGHFYRHSVRYKTGYGTGISARVDATCLEDTAEQQIKQNNLKPVHHPGRFRLPKVALPEKFRHAAEKILQHEKIKDIKEQAEYLGNYIWCRTLPIEKEGLNAKVKKIEAYIKKKDDVLLPFLSQDETVKLEQKWENQVLNKLRKSVYHWEPIRYTKQKALQYMFSRSAAEYAILCRIFSEISKRHPEFKPKTLCDYGSGVGTVTWAARTFWADTLYEHLCADVSWEMNELAELLLKGGCKNNNHSIPALFFRQHLPESYKIRYNLVVSSFSLMELPSAKDRLTLIDKLWNKTEEYLVIVEAGTNAGFQAVIEARDYILGLGSTTKPSRHCHVFSPCPHSLECPRYAFDNIPCNFEVKYRPLYPFHKDDCKVDRFCYVVLRRGPPSPDDELWHRVIEEPKIRPRHVICRVCTKNAKISEVVLTKAKHSQELRLIAKRSSWGDLLPFKTIQYKQKYPKSSNDDENENPTP